MKSCFLIGHREASSEVLPALMEAIEQHIVEYGVTEFIVGNYGGFDHMAAKAVITAKERHPDITLSMLDLRGVPALCDAFSDYLSGIIVLG